MATKQPKRRFTDPIQRQIRQLYWKQNLSCASIATQFKANPSTIAKILGGSRATIKQSNYYEP